MLFELLFQTSGIWFPILIIIWCFTAGRKMWAEYIMKEAISKVEWVMLEIRTPQDVFKTPLAMEMIFMSLRSGTPAITELTFSDLFNKFSDFYKAYWKGDIFANYASLEIASTEGRVSFYIRTVKKNQQNVENVIYAQYPRAEVTVVDDYTKMIPEWTPEGDWVLDACEWATTKDDAYPIRTYVDWGLDSKSLGLDEEQKIDPISPMIETFGAISSGEHLWIQFVIREATKKKNKDGELKDWITEGQDFIKKIIKEHSNTEIITTKDDKEVKNLVGGFKNLSPIDQEIVEAIQKSIQKYGFDVGIRALYLAKKDSDKKRLASLKTAFNHFNWQYLNNFKASGPGFSLPWEDTKDKRKNKQLKEYFEFYINRTFFYPPAKDKKIFVLNTEELATIFHFPGRTITTPSFTRVESQKSGPPPNLPIG